MSSDRQLRAVRSGDSLYRFPNLNDAATISDFYLPQTAIFVHGFTANAEYMSKLMYQFNGAGFNCLAFEYASFRGIDHAAKNLCDILALIDGQSECLTNNRVVLVGHSMGGLVARTMVLLYGGATFVRKVITLGTPHDGTLKDSRFLEYMAAWGEQLSGLNPGGYGPSNASGLQLIGADTPNPLLARLRDATPPNPSVQFYSFSGGYPTLEFGRSKFKNFIANSYLQSRLSPPNDGLVSESSSNLKQACAGTFLEMSEHYNSYNEYQYTNHSELINNPTVALTAIKYALA